MTALQMGPRSAALLLAGAIATAALPQAGAQELQTGKPIRLIFRTTYKGQVVAFCCQDCKAEFEKNPGRYNVKPAEPK